MVRSQGAYGAGMIALGPGVQLQPVPAAARMWGSRHRVARTGAGRAPAIAIVILSPPRSAAWLGFTAGDVSAPVPARADAGPERPSAQAGGRAM